MLEFTVKQNDAGRRIDTFLFRLLPECPRSLIYKAFRKKDVRLNGKKADISSPISVGDTVTIYLPADIKPTPVSKKPVFLKASKKLVIVYEDDNILIADKPAGLLCHSDKNNFSDTLIDRVKRYLYENGQYDPQSEQCFSPALCNRIDRNTCGLVIAAKNAESLRIINSLIKQRQISKYYVCLAKGKMPKQNDTLVGYIQKNEDANISTVSDGSNGRKIITEYTVKNYKNGVSLLEIHLITGRTHQIRAHLASIGHPLIGDPKYGKRDDREKYPYQALCAERVLFSVPSDEAYSRLFYLDKKEFFTDNIWFLNR